MLINKLGLKNFKCFKEVEVDFAKITLLTGENSSGKSSLIYGLLAPFQSEGFPLYLFPNGKYVNMGDSEEISFKQQVVLANAQHPFAACFSIGIVFYVWLFAEKKICLEGIILWHAGMIIFVS